MSTNAISTGAHSASFDYPTVLRHFRATHCPKSIIVGGQSWSYLSGGAGEQTVVLLPGGLGGGEAWFRIMLALEPFARIITPSYPPVTSMAALVKGIEHILAAEEYDQVTLVGTSMGGFLAQCFVRAFPERVQQLVLSNTTAPNPTYAAKIARRQPKGLAWMPTWLIVRLMLPGIMRFLRVLPRSERAFWRDYLRQKLALEARDRLGAMHACCADFAQQSFLPTDLQDWSGQIHLLAVEDDQAFDEAQRQILQATYPQATVTSMQYGGHMSAITQPEAYIAHIQRALQARQCMRETSLALA